MNHIEAGTCPECDRQMYVVWFPNNEPKSLNIPGLCHLDERCAITPSYDDLLQPA